MGVVALLIGCVSPIARHHAVLAYDRSVERVTTEQLLVNIIRAQSPLFRSTGRSSPRVSSAARSRRRYGMWTDTSIRRSAPDRASEIRNAKVFGMLYQAIVPNAGAACQCECPGHRDREITARRLRDAFGMAVDGYERVCRHRTQKYRQPLRPPDSYSGRTVCRCS